MQQTAARPSLAWLFPLFFASGFAALLYQVVWQRALFTLYGTNVESVTVIVTAFMLGLGVGSLLGGQVSKNPRANVARLFALAEVGIGRRTYSGRPPHPRFMSPRPGRIPGCCEANGGRAR